MAERRKPPSKPSVQGHLPRRPTDANGSCRTGCHLNERGILQILLLEAERSQQSDDAGDGPTKGVWMSEEADPGLSVLVQIRDLYQEVGIENPSLEAARLLELLSGRPLGQRSLGLLLQKKKGLLDLARQRKNGVPLEYIVGLARFMGRTFYCSPGTFIPKEQTEALCRVALEFLKTQERGGSPAIIDMGTGCGNIAITLALNSHSARIYGSDISPKAIEIAQKNVDAFQLRERVTLLCGDLFSPFEWLDCEGTIDLIVCAPPYIPTGSLRKLSPEVVDYEPRIALDGGPFGIDFYRRLVAESLSMLKPRGRLVLEIGVGQEELIARVLSGKGNYEQVQHHDEGAGVRVVSARKK